MSIVSIVHLYSTADPLVSAGLYCCLECVSVVEVLHGLTAQVDTQLLQLGGLAVLKAKHVQDANEAVLSMSHGLAEDGEALGGLLAACGANC